MIFAIASLIGQAVWQKILDSIPKSRAILVNHEDSEFAHISWIISQQMDVLKVEKTIKTIASAQTPVVIRSGGLGVFCGDKPVITLQLVRNSAVNRLHTKVWTKCHDDMENSKPYYSPDSWMPHVTLVHDEFTTRGYADFLLNCIYSSIQIDITLTNLAILYQDGQDAGVLSCYDFSNGA